MIIFADNNTQIDLFPLNTSSKFSYLLPRPLFLEGGGGIQLIHAEFPTVVGVSKTDFVYISCNLAEYSSFFGKQQRVVGVVDLQGRIYRLFSAKLEDISIVQELSFELYNSSGELLTFEQQQTGTRQKNNTVIGVQIKSW